MLAGKYHLIDMATPTVDGVKALLRKCQQFHRVSAEAMECEARKYYPGRCILVRRCACAQA